MPKEQGDNYVEIKVNKNGNDIVYYINIKVENAVLPSVIEINGNEKIIDFNFNTMTKISGDLLWEDEGLYMEISETYLENENSVNVNFDLKNYGLKNGNKVDYGSFSESFQLGESDNGVKYIKLNIFVSRFFSLDLTIYFTAA